jgi:hypothetical protein
MKNVLKMQTFIKQQKNKIKLQLSRQSMILLKRQLHQWNRIHLLEVDTHILPTYYFDKGTK